MRIRERLFALLMILILLSALGGAAFAQDVPDLSKNGSITVTMREGSTAVAGGTLTLYRVGAVSGNDGDYSFRLTGDFRMCGQSLEDIQSPELASALADYAKNHSCKSTTQSIDRNGTVKFSNLELGLYLLVQNKAASGYLKAEPFLVSVPMMENGSYVYEVDASPKVEVEKDTEPTTPPPNPTSPGKDLPKTGQLSWPIPILVVAGLILFLIGWTLRFRKRDSYEK